MGYRECGFADDGFPGVVYKNGIPSCVERPGNVRILVVTNHYAFLRVGSGFAECKIENFFVWFQGHGPFAGNYLHEIFSKVGRCNFRVLHFFKTIGDQMEDIVFFTQVAKQFVGMGKQRGLPGQQFKVLTAQLFGQHIVGQFVFQHRMPEPFPAQVFLANMAIAVALPKPRVVNAVFAVKIIKIRREPGIKAMAGV